MLTQEISLNDSPSRAGGGGEMEHVIAMRLNEKVNALLRRSHLETMMKGSFLAKLGGGYHTFTLTYRC